MHRRMTPAERADRATERDARAAAYTAAHLRDPWAGGGLAARIRRAQDRQVGRTDPYPPAPECGATGWTREEWPGKPDGWTCDRVREWHPAPPAVTALLDRMAARRDRR